MSLAVLMVSSVPYRGWKTLRLRRRDILGIALVLGFTLVMAVQFDISLAFFTSLAVYSASGPVEALLTGRWSVGAEPMHAAAASAGSRAAARENEGEDDALDAEDD